ncbi:MAG: hypothetical protein LUC93_17085 [Planctomycetaceae bacterium]|nr:hypothetical protein [Planctomycetaceae bacterium]
MSAVSEDMVLAPLRPDVQFISGPVQDDGSPTLILHDNFNDTFDLVEWQEREIVYRLGSPIKLGDLEERLRRETTVRVTREELLRFIVDLRQRGLVRGSGFLPVEELLRQEALQKHHPLGWLISHYLFFRVPLIKPNALLRRTLWLPRFFGSPLMVAVYAAVAIAAVLLLFPRLELFVQSATPFLAWKGAVYLTLAMVAIKVCHEFSHAYAASIRGARVRSMGLAFMVMAPIPYADVTDAWRLPRRQRIAISAAGVRTEMILAAFAALMWCLVAPGPFRDVCLMLASASVLSALLTNLNPGMRFDGYYLLSDIIGVDNLQVRAFAQARHWFRRMFLGLDDGGDVESALGRGKKAALVLWSIYTVMYRLGLYLGIAVLVYHYFPKIIGIVLFAVEITVFIVKPVIREVKASSKLIRVKGMTVRAWIVAALLSILALWFIIPLPRTIGIDAVVVADGEAVIYAPESGMIAVNALKRGGLVRRGEVMVVLTNPEVDSAIQQTELHVREVDIQLERALAGGDDRTYLRDRLAEQSRLASQLAGLQSAREKMTVRAEEDCTVLDADESAVPGVWLARRAQIARVMAHASGRRLVGYLPDSDVNAVEDGDSAWFSPGSSPGIRVAAVVSHIDTKSASRIEEPPLAGPYGGGMAVVQGGDGLTPANPVYRMEAVFLEEENPDLRIGQRGTLQLHTPPRSLAWETLLWLYSVLIRESGI